MTKTIQIKQQFRSAIRRGTGEAYLLARQHPEVDFSNDIIKASLKNFAYDGQCEGSRAEYLWSIILLSRQQNKIREAILKGLTTEKVDTWSLVQLFDLAKFCAQEGDSQARQVIYDRFSANINTRADWAGYDVIIDLDGSIEGLKYIAEKMGKGLQYNPDDWQDDSIIRYFEECYPEINARQELEEAAADNPFIKIYLDEIKRSSDRRNTHPREQIIYADVVEEVLSKKSFRFFRMNLSEADLNLVAQRFLSEKNKQNQEKLLAVFTKNKYPLDSDYILELAKQYRKRGNKLAKIAIDALAFLKSGPIRQFAIEQLNNSKKPELFTCILQANYQNGDSALLSSLVKKATSEYVIECLVYDYVSIFGTNKTAECQEPLKAIYDKSNCGMHRADVVNLLIENNVLSEKIRTEIQFDCDEKTRKLAEVPII